MSKTNIYILKLTNNKYYVGKTDNLERRIQEHLNGTASTWTKKYKLIDVEDIIRNASSFDEDKYTLQYMDKYGVDNVRGGQYATEALDERQRDNIQKSLWANNDCCNQCGRKGHFINNCKFTSDINGKSIKIQKDNSKIKIKTCFECLEEGHYATECPNKQVTFNCQYCNKQFETQKGATFHENRHCKSKYEEQEEIFNCQYCDKEFDTQRGTTYHENFYCKSKNTDSNKRNKCYRCGRSGHYSDDCYADTHVRGYELD
jgi:cellular nucleic acid-binding protein